MYTYYHTGFHQIFNGPNDPNIYSYYTTHEYYSDVKVQFTLYRHGDLWAPILLYSLNSRRATDRIDVHLLRSS